jgi:uncharacterized protein
MKWILIVPVVIYRLTLSRVMPPCCRFQPTCAEYMYRALLRHGAVKGLWLGIGRLCRCQPFCRGGLDPVPGDACGVLPSSPSPLEPPARA